MRGLVEEEEEESTLYASSITISGAVVRDALRTEAIRFATYGNGRRISVKEFTCPWRNATGSLPVMVCKSKTKTSGSLPGDQKEGM